MVPAAIDHIMLLRQAWMRMVKRTAKSRAMASDATEISPSETCGIYTKNDRFRTFLTEMLNLFPNLAKDFNSISQNSQKYA